MTATTALTLKGKYDKVSGLIASMAPELEKALPQHITADRMARIALTSFRKNPKLLDCTPASLMGTLMEASQLGLALDGVTGEAYPVPFNGQCTLILGYKGLIKLAYNSGVIKSIYARVVHREDHFKYVLGTNETITHKPSVLQDPGPTVAFYSVAVMVSGGVKIEVMHKHEVDKIRNASRGKDLAPWSDYYDEMGKKTVLRRNCKTLPASTELQRAVALDEMAEAGVPQNLRAGVDFTVEDEDSGGPETGRVEMNDLKKPAEQQAQSGGNAGPTDRPSSREPGAPDIIAELDKILAKSEVTGDDYGYAFELADPDKQFALDDEMNEFIRRGDWYAAVRWIKRQAEAQK